MSGQGLAYPWQIADSFANIFGFAMDSECIQEMPVVGQHSLGSHFHLSVNLLTFIGCRQRLETILTAHAAKTI
jgi:hypothetical protein